MINILLDDGGNNELFDQPDKKHGDGYNPDEVRGKLVRLRPEREQMIKDDFKTVVVRDFGDEYHLTEEERREKFKFYEAFKVFSKCKHKYRKLNEFVKAVREAIKCLDIVAENNGVYEPEVFKHKFFKGEIYVNGLVFPKFNGREKKSISWEYLAEFILSDAPAEEILDATDDDSYLSEEDMDMMTKKLFSEKELSNIIDTPETEENKILENTYFDIYDDINTVNDNTNIVVSMSEKESRKFIKSSPEFLYTMKNIQRSKIRKDNLSRYVYDLTSDDIDLIAEYDHEHGYYSNADMPEFKGNIFNDDDYNRYMMELNEFERTQIKRDYHGKLKTQEEIDEIELKRTLESHSWNIRNLYGNKEKEEKLRKIAKDEKKKERRIREKLIKLESRRKRRLGEDIDDEKDGKNKNKKKQKKKKDKDDNNEKNMLKREISEDIDDFLLGTAGRIDDTFSSYKEDVTDWSFSNIFGGSES